MEQNQLIDLIYNFNVETYFKELKKGTISDVENELLKSPYLKEITKLKTFQYSDHKGTLDLFNQNKPYENDSEKWLDLLLDSLATVKSNSGLVNLFNLLLLNCLSDYELKDTDIPKFEYVKKELSRDVLMCLACYTTEYLDLLVVNKCIYWREDDLRFYNVNLENQGFFYNANLFSIGVLSLGTGKLTTLINNLNLLTFNEGDLHISILIHYPKTHAEYKDIKEEYLNIINTYPNVTIGLNKDWLSFNKNDRVVLKQRWGFTKLSRIVLEKIEDIFWYNRKTTIFRAKINLFCYKDILFNNKK